VRLLTQAGTNLLASIDRPEPVRLFDQPNSAPLIFEMPASGTVLVTFSTVVAGQNGGSPFEWLLWLDNGPAPTMPIPATVTVAAGGTPISSTQLLTLGPGSHRLQVLVRSPSGVPLTVSHSHLTKLAVPEGP
jgi:hypothetical protein